MSYPAFPSITPNAADFALVSNTQTMRSELNGTVQTAALPGDVWVGTFTFSNKFDPDARILRAFLAGQRGEAGRFGVKPPAYRRAGTALGTPLVKGAGQSGLTLNIDGCTGSQALFLAAGDYFQVGDELKIMTADATSDSDGNATLHFTPPLRVSPSDNAVIIVTDPRCKMKLKDGNQARWQAQPTPIFSLTVACEEALDL